MGRPKLELDPVTRERILDAVIYHINRQGFNGAKTSDIAATAGLDEAKLFRLFPSKQKLANEALRMAQAILDYTAQITPSGKDIDADARRFLTDAIWHFANFYQRYPDRFYYVFIASHREFIDEEGKLIRQKYRSDSYALVNSLIKAKYLVDAEPEVILAMIFGTLSRYVRVAFDDQRPLQRKSVEEIIELLIKALLPPR